MSKITKSKFLIFRVTREEKKIIEDKAEKGGFAKISDYLRNKLGL